MQKLGQKLFELSNLTEILQKLFESRNSTKIL
jgi:hypothetical protein